MSKLFSIFLLIFLFNLPLGFAESKLLVDATIDSLLFKKPERGVGKAGTLILKSANINNMGIVLNVNNVNNIFDSQIFVRPTFLGFTTQFGSYGFSLSPDSIVSTVYFADLKNSKLVMDDNQLNLSGEYLNYLMADSSIKLKKFRVYCQSASKLDQPMPESVEGNDSESSPNSDFDNDMMKNCFKFLTLNGNYALVNNEIAALEYEGLDKLTGGKVFVDSEIKSFDLRKNQINADLKMINSASNANYFIKANDIFLNCDKDENLEAIDIAKIKKTCMNRLDIAPFKAKITDKVEKSTFDLDVKKIAVKSKNFNLVLNHGILADATSATSLSNFLLNCRKESDTDLFELNQVLRDCITLSRITIGKIDNSGPDDKNSSIKNVSVNSNQGALAIQAEVKILGINAKVIIYGRITLKEEQKQVVINVTDTKLPLGINSVKMLMHFLKKNLISKDISISKNVITVSL